MNSERGESALKDCGHPSNLMERPFVGVDMMAFDGS